MEACIPQLEQAVAVLRRHMADAEAGGHCELEVRLGHLPRAARFLANVKPLTFRLIVQALEACTQWTETRVWLQSMDVFYMDDEGREVRSTMEVSSNVKHIHKQRVHSMMLLCSGERGSRISEEGLDLRLTVNTETPATRLPDTVQPTWVRVKQRRSFRFRHWQWDVSRVWQGRDRLTVDAMQREEAPAYEVELELVDPAPYLAEHPDKYIAQSLVRKVWDLVARVANDAALRYTHYASDDLPAPQVDDTVLAAATPEGSHGALMYVPMDCTPSSIEQFLAALRTGNTPVAVVADEGKFALVQDFVDHCRTLQHVSLGDVVRTSTPVAVLAECVAQKGVVVDAPPHALAPMQAMEELARLGSGHEGGIYHFEEGETVWSYVCPCPVDLRNAADTHFPQSTDMVWVCEACQFCAPLLEKWRDLHRADACVPRAGCPISPEQ